MLGPKTLRLVELLDQLVAELDSLGLLLWRDWFAESVRRLRASDLSGVRHLLRAYGGMGSFNDLAPGQATATAERLGSEVYALAREIEREATLDSGDDSGDGEASVRSR